jgi:hypothetical protein
MLAPFSPARRVEILQQMASDAGVTCDVSLVGDRILIKTP